MVWMGRVFLVLVSFGVNRCLGKCRDFFSEIHICQSILHAEVARVSKGKRYETSTTMTH